MPITFTFDLDGSRFTSTNTAVTWERLYRAQGIDVDTPAEMIEQVMLELPQRGTVAPDPWIGMTLTAKTLDRLIGDPETNLPQAFGALTYSFSTSTATAPPPPDDDQDVTSIAVTSFTEEVEIEKDWDGTRITVEDSDGVVRGETVTVPMARARIAARRKELNYPKSRMDGYVNRLNLGIWNGYAQGTVRLETIDVDTVSGGNNYDVQYVFIQRPEGWNGIEVVGRDLLTGKPIAAPSGAQLASVSPYELISFLPLNITFG